MAFARLGAQSTQFTIIGAQGETICTIKVYIRQVMFRLSLTPQPSRPSDHLGLSWKTGKLHCVEMAAGGNGRSIGETYTPELQQLVLAVRAKSSNKVEQSNLSRIRRPC